LIGYPPQIRRAYRPWRKPWRSGFDSRHGVPPFDHATCPSDSAERQMSLPQTTRVHESAGDL
jgi:hypothetical protein